MDRIKGISDGIYRFNYFQIYGIHFGRVNESPCICESAVRQTNDDMMSANVDHGAVKRFSTRRCVFGARLHGVASHVIVCSLVRCQFCDLNGVRVDVKET